MANAAYLKENVADALSDGLAATVAAQPDDPVEYLGNFLIDYVKRIETIKQVCVQPTVAHAVLP